MKHEPKRFATIFRVTTAMIGTLAVCSTAFAQITITNATFPAAGDTLRMAIATPSLDLVQTVATPPSFDAQTWDLSNLQVDLTLDIVYRPVSEGSVQVPGADFFAVISPFPDNFYYMPDSWEEYYKITNDQFEVLAFYGLAFNLDINGAFNFKPPFVERRAPVNFFDITQSSSGILEKFSPSAFPPAFIAAIPAQLDSLRYRISINRLDAVNAFGSLSIPGGTYNVLRQKRTRYQETRLDGKVPPLGWLDITDIALQNAGARGLGVDTTETYYFLNDVEKEPIATLSITYSGYDPILHPVAFKYNAPPPAPILSINDVALNEGNADTTTFDFTVSLNIAAPAGGVTFDIATADGTTDPATAPSDYTAKSLTGQTIPAGSSTYTFSVLVNGDTDFEPNETFFVNVSNVTGADVGDAQGLGTITNDDAAAIPPAFSLQFTPDVITEGGTSTLSFAVDNSSNTVAATSLDFTNNLPAGVVVASPANASVTCTGGTLTATAGSGVISYAGGVVAAGASCTIQVDVTSATAGTYITVTGDLTSSLGNSGTATATLTVSPATTAIVTPENTIPTRFNLEQNYPNPFNPTTTLGFDLPEAANVSLRIYDINGRVVHTLVSGAMNAGMYNIQWNGTDDSGAKVAGGIYLYRIKAGSFVKTMKMILVK